MSSGTGIRRRKDSDAWQGSFWVGGRRFQRVIAHDAELAGMIPAHRDRFLQSRYDEMAARIAVEAPAPAKDARLTLSEAWQDFMDAQAGRLAAGTLAYYTRTGNALLEAVGDPPLRGFGAGEVDRFVNALRAPHGDPPRTLSVASVNIRLQCLNAFLRWAAERGLIDRPPRVRQLRREHRLPRVLARDDLARLIHRLQHPATVRQRQAYPLHLRALMVALGTGLRRAELFYLRWDQIDLAAGVLRVEFQPRFSIKERREKHPPLPPFLHAFLAAQRPPPDSPAVYLLDDGTGRLAFWGPDALTLAFRRHYEALKIPPARRPKAMHGFRALYATQLHESGTDDTTIQGLLGHADIKVTQGYFSRTTERERQAAATLELPPAPPQV